ncbi:hypothetical protein [Methylomonas rivi]|uniref:Uncharacterized protein n=1 Tax=Methylomonas rivi TaxID=2952226 RepID=A0ABT1U6U9_9GAMM|nr:hypothetical protein [Methylomonas sp. WSC-6]MCQ8129586.1 hypothetical protein [Methylomonas sp. WSC-6]
MAHPYIQINGKRWAETLQFLQEIVCQLALRDGVDDETAEAYMQQYQAVADGNNDKIFNATVQRIKTYINFYNVHPSQGIYDEFKCIYFVGMAMSFHLAADGLTDLNKLHLRAMLRLLDLRLEEPFNVRRPQLSDRINKAILNDSIQKHFGDYGWYIVYKCLYNAANDNSKTI